MQVIFLIRQGDRKSLGMKSTARQEHNLNFKRNSYIPKMRVDPCPVGSTTQPCSLRRRTSGDKPRDTPEGVQSRYNETLLPI